MHGHYRVSELRYEDPVSYFNYLRMQTKRRQRSGSYVNAQYTRSTRAVTTRCTPTEVPQERYETTRSPWDRRENVVISQISMRSRGELENLRTPCSRSGNAARCDMDFIYEQFKIKRFQELKNRVITQLGWTRSNKV